MAGVSAFLQRYAPSMDAMPRIPREGPAVLAALPSQSAAEFLAAWNALLDQARDKPDLEDLTERLKKLVGGYWAVASAWASPRAAEITEEGRCWAAGDDRDSISLTEVLGRVQQD